MKIQITLDLEKFKDRDAGVGHVVDVANQVVLDTAMKGSSIGLDRGALVATLCIFAGQLIETSLVSNILADKRSQKDSKDKFDQELNDLVNALRGLGHNSINNLYGTVAKITGRETPEELKAMLKAKPMPTINKDFLSGFGGNKDA